MRHFFTFPKTNQHHPALVTLAQPTDYLRQQVCGDGPMSPRC